MNTLEMNPVVQKAQNLTGIPNTKKVIITWTLRGRLLSARNCSIKRITLRKQREANVHDNQRCGSLLSGRRSASSTSRQALLGISESHLQLVYETLLRRLDFDVLRHSVFPLLNRGAQQSIEDGTSRPDVPATSCFLNPHCLDDAQCKLAYSETNQQWPESHSLILQLVEAQGSLREHAHLL